MRGLRGFQARRPRSRWLYPAVRAAPTKEPAETAASRSHPPADENRPQTKPPPNLDTAPGTRVLIPKSTTVPTVQIQILGVYPAVLDASPPIQVDWRGE